MWFFPWKYHSREDVWRGLISEVIIHSLKIENADVSRAIKAAKQFGMFLGRSFLQVLSGAEVGTGPQGAKVKLEGIKDIPDIYRECVKPEKAFLNEFEDALRSWVEDTVQDDKRLAIFIDDLDRCMPEVALEVLEALKLYLRIKNIIFIVGVDPKVVEDLVKRHYETLGLKDEKSTKYLQKMFQVEVDLGPSAEQIDTFMKEQLVEIGQWKDLEETVQDIFLERIKNLAENNPREVKRLINSALMLGAGAVMKEEREWKNVKFEQGVQFFFIRRILRNHDLAAKLRETPLNDFFVEWSKIACEDKTADARFFSPRIPKGKGEVEQGEALERPTEQAPHERDEQQKRFEPLTTNPKYNEFGFLGENKDLAELMKIEYIKTIAQFLAKETGHEAQEVDRARSAGRVRGDDIPTIITGTDQILLLRQCPGGNFDMGAPKSEEESSDVERPVHNVTVSSFLIGKYPITQAQWKAVMGSNPSNFEGDNRPVECVSWNKCDEFLEKLNALVPGEGFRLPTEAEWEYACRAGTTTPFNTGETLTTDQANFDGRKPYGDSPKGVYRGSTTEVGMFSPNAYGLHDMHGNVWEWCEDDWHGSYQGAPDDGSPWLDEPRGKNRVLRGGGWRNSGLRCRSAARIFSDPDYENRDVGLRVVRTP